LSYYDNDLARSITQAGTITTFTIDALDRRAIEAVTTTSGTTQTLRHYTDTSDNPTWVTQGAIAQRYAELIGTDLALTIDQTGSADLALANNHGDIVTTIDLPSSGTSATSIAAWNSYDEYGNGVDMTAHTGVVDYGWLGGKQRALSGAGLTLMGARLYNPVTGLFTSTDPVAGGNANAYVYPTDPVNRLDLDGKRWRIFKKSFKYKSKSKWKHGFKSKWRYKHRRRKLKWPKIYRSYRSHGGRGNAKVYKSYKVTGCDYAGFIIGSAYGLLVRRITPWIGTPVAGYVGLSATKNCYNDQEKPKSYDTKGWWATD
jgi:RHS repeat-associated protein